MRREHVCWRHILSYLYLVIIIISCQVVSEIVFHPLFNVSVERAISRHDSKPQALLLRLYFVLLLLLSVQNHGHSVVDLYDPILYQIHLLLLVGLKSVELL